MAERRWITREEIAEIHEAIAEKSSRDSMAALGRGKLGAAEEHLDHSLVHINMATEIRQIDKTGNFSGKLTRR